MALIDRHARWRARKRYERVNDLIRQYHMFQARAERLNAEPDKVSEADTFYFKLNYLDFGLVLDIGRDRID